MREGKPDNIKPYIDFENGWKFTEDDKEFLVSYYKDYIETLWECADGDFVEDYEKILKSITENGVEKSRELIQDDARNTADAVHDDIYQYYKNSPDALRLIEGSILDFQIKTYDINPLTRQVHSNII